MVIIQPFGLELYGTALSHELKTVCLPNMLMQCLCHRTQTDRMNSRSSHSVTVSQYCKCQIRRWGTGIRAPVISFLVVTQKEHFQLFG